MYTNLNHRDTPSWQILLNHVDHHAFVWLVLRHYCISISCHPGFILIKYADVHGQEVEELA